MHLFQLPDKDYVIHLQLAVLCLQSIQIHIQVNVLCFQLAFGFVVGFQFFLMAPSKANLSLFHPIFR